MKRETLSDAFNLLDDNIIEETAALRSHPARRRGWIRWVAAAAALVLVGYGGLSGLFREDRSALPMLTISQDFGGMGFEGYWAYDISQLVSANPWQDTAEGTLLPVFENPLRYDENHIAHGGDFETMEQVLLETAKNLGLDTDSLEITDNTPDEETRRQITEKMTLTGGSLPPGYFDPDRLIAQAEGIRIEVDLSLTVRVEFSPAVSLPEPYVFEHYATYEQCLETAQYLQETYVSLLGERTALNVSGGEYNIYQQQSYSISFFDASGSDIRQILSYNFGQTEFCCDDEGKLFLIRASYPDLSKVGDYPVITSEQARQLLIQGSYVTSVPYEMPGEEYIRKVELTYRTGSDLYFMPYYRFYVEIPQEQWEEMKTYGAYYVPAGEQRYISNMPSWDGSFNS